MDGGNLEQFNAKYGDPYDPQLDCQHKWTITKVSATVFEGHCEKCDLTTTEILHVEYWHENQKEDPFIRIGGKRYRALKSWGNIAPCSQCGKIFFECPLILWAEEDPSKALVFCPKCGEIVLEGSVKDAGHIILNKQKEKSEA